MNKNIDWLKVACVIAAGMGYFSISIFGIHPVTIGVSIIIIASILLLLIIIRDKRENTKDVVLEKIALILYMLFAIFIALGTINISILNIILGVIFFILALLVSKMVKNIRA